MVKDSVLPHYKDRVHACKRGNTTKGVAFWVLEYKGEVYQGDFYTDPECTQVYEIERDEQTLYIPAQG